MKYLAGFTAAVAGIAVAGSVAMAGGHGGNPVANARSSTMGLYSYYLGVLGGMARGNTEYDAEVAVTAAKALAGVATADQSLLWIEGTDRESIEGTRALPKIWTDPEGFAAELEKISKAADAAVLAVANGLPDLQAAVGGVGASCGSCHEAYRGPRN